MGRVIDVVIYCANSNNRYKAYFEEKSPLKWYGTTTEKMSPPSFFEKLALKARSKKHDSGFSFAKFNSPLGKSSGKTNVQGAFFIGTHRCPFCGNTNFVKCGVCNEWTCNTDGSNRFKCAVCGNSGNITGQIDAASGNLSQSSGNNKKIF
ncbi:MAG: hypothetical protein IJS67_03385 [Clostridia bacterium]|nr:hypothetical protein [Clostridia bacterium]